MNKDVFKEKLSKLIDPEKYWFEVNEYSFIFSYYQVIIGDNEGHKVTHPVSFASDEYTKRDVNKLIASLSPECKRCDDGIGRFIYVDTLHEEQQKSLICKKCFKKVLED